MGSRILIIYILVPFAIALTLIDSLHEASSQDRLEHPGRVVDMDTGQPVLVDIKAWPESSQSEYSGDCPSYGSSSLDSTQSDPDVSGLFVLNVDAHNPTYTATYCAGNYYPRADRNLPNRINRSRVRPYPVKVLKREVSHATYKQLIETKTFVLLDDLAYLQSIHPDNFDTIMRTLAAEIGESFPSRKKVLQNFAGFVEKWRK